MKIANKHNDSNLLYEKLIYPFIFDCCDFKEVIDKTCKSTWKFSKNKIYSNNSELFNHIEDLVVNSNVKNNKFIGCNFEIPKENIKKKYKNCYMQLENEKVKIDILDINLYLFKTNIGFLTIGIDYATDDIEKIIECNYIIKELVKYRIEKSKKHFYHEEQIDFSLKVKNDDIYNEKLLNEECFEVFNTIKKCKSYIKSSLVSEMDKGTIVDNNGVLELRYSVKYKKNLCDIVMSLLKPINTVNKISFFNDKKISNEYGFDSIISKANIFVSTFVEEEDYNSNAFKEIFYELRKGYKGSYEPSESELDYDKNDGLLNFFKGNYWGISREGLTNLGCIFKHTQNKFYENGYDDKLKTYFYLYILVLHQYYGLINLSREISELPIATEHYLLEVENYNKLLLVKDRVNFFYMKCVFSEISHITHQNILYKKLYNELGVKKMIDELSFECESITKIVDERKAIITRQNEIRAYNRGKLFVTIGALLAFISVVQCVWEITCYYYYDSVLHANDVIAQIIISFIGTLSVIGVGFIAGLFWALWLNRNK